MTKFAQVWLCNLKNQDKTKVNKNKKKFEVILTKQAWLIKDLYFCLQDQGEKFQARSAPLTRSGIVHVANQNTGFTWSSPLVDSAIWQKHFGMQKKLTSGILPVVHSLDTHTNDRMQSTKYSFKKSLTPNDSTVKIWGCYMQLQARLDHFLKFSFYLPVKISLPTNWNFPGKIADEYEKI